jgi:heme oxygenase
MLPRWSRGAECEATGEMARRTSERATWSLVANMRKLWAGFRTDQCPNAVIPLKLGGFLFVILGFSPFLAYTWGFAVISAGRIATPAIDPGPYRLWSARLKSSVAISRSLLFRAIIMIQLPIEVVRRDVCLDVTKGASPKTKPKQGLMHRALRDATRKDCALIDRMMLPFNLGRPEHYRTFLEIHLAAFSSLQGDCRPQDSEDFTQMLRCIEADLETLGYKTKPTVPCCASASEPKGLGIAYVVRSSRFGAVGLRRGVKGNLPTAYLDFAPALSWPAFLKHLEFIVDNPSDRDEATRSAQRTCKTVLTELEQFKGLIERPSWSHSDF